MQINEKQRTNNNREKETVNSQKRITKSPQLQLQKKFSLDEGDFQNVQTQNTNNKQYVAKLFGVYKKLSFLPSYQIKYEISSILSKLVQQKQKTIYQYKQQSLLQSIINQQQLKIYQSKKDYFNQNNFLIEVIKKTKHIFLFIQNYIDSSAYFDFKNKSRLKEEEGLDNLKTQKVESKRQKFMNQLGQFSKLIKLIQQFSNFMGENSDDIRKCSDQKLHSMQISQFCNKVYEKIFQSVIHKTNRNELSLKINQILIKYHLPLKRNKKQKSQKQALQTKIKESDLDFIQFVLNRQACEYALSNYLSTLTNSDDSFRYKSIFFAQYYKKLNQAIQYLFINKNQSHNILQPNWMFDYIQQTFVLNYNLIKDQLLKGLQDQNQGNILIYALQYSIVNLFFSNIKKRLQYDLKQDNTKKDSYFYFRFIDTLHQLDQKLSILFSQQISLLQNILIQFQIKSNQQILQRNFDYQHKWIEQKIFKDFWETINYSRIDLKNIQAYNIVSNFNVLFQKLYSKFVNIYDQKLVKKINQFYQESVRNLAAHLKTSFQRIFRHSGLNQLSIILAFKRVDNQFKAGLNGFIKKDLEFQKQIKQEYYEYILTFFNAHALEELGIYHRRLLKATSQFEKYFTVQNLSEEQVKSINQKSYKIFQNWSKKLQQLNQVYNYKDPKIKNQFFTFLQSIDFTEKGLAVFLSIYQPFLQIFYSFEGYNILKMVILMDKKQQLQYLKVHNNLVSFLLQSQISAIRKLKIR